MDEKGTLRFWINGEMMGKRTGKLTSNEPKYAAVLGAATKAGDNVRRSRDTVPFRGLIDEFLVFNRALSESEVESLFAIYQPFLD